MAKKRPSSTDMRKAKRIHSTRPRKAQDVDEAMTARVTPFFEVWKTDPSRWDFMGVDTKKQGKKNKQEDYY